MNLRYQSGFGNEFATEAVEGALPHGCNSPQRPPLGLYAEQLSGTPFTAARHLNRRTWFYRIRPSVQHSRFRKIEGGKIRTAPFTETETSPNQMRWNPLPFPPEKESIDFVQGITTVGGNGSAEAHSGVGIHWYVCNTSMKDKFFYNADGEMLIVPQAGHILFFTEMGKIDVQPGEIVVIPRGVRFRVEIIEGPARGYICENYGPFFRIPDLGPIGANGLANPRDFLTPVAAFEEHEGDFALVVKLRGNLWQAQIPVSPLNVVAWHGNYAPYKYDLRLFNTINTVSYDHPDPSIFTVLTAPTETPGHANCDFAIFPPRWMVAENTFRPPWFHRNYMSEFMGLVYGEYDAKAEGFVPGGSSLHNCMSGHGPDVTTFERASAVELKPHYIDKTLAFMFETKMAVTLTSFAAETPLLQPDYNECWRDFTSQFGK